MPVGNGRCNEVELGFSLLISVICAQLPGRSPDMVTHPGAEDIVMEAIGQGRPPGRVMLADAESRPDALRVLKSRALGAGWREGRHGCYISLGRWRREASRNGSLPLCVNLTCK